MGKRKFNADIEVDGKIIKKGGLVSQFLKANGDIDATLYLAITQLLTEILKIDGAGSGIDSDLLDGQQGEWYNHRIHGIGTNSTNGSSARVQSDGVTAITSFNHFHQGGMHQTDFGMGYTDGPEGTGSKGGLLNIITHATSVGQLFIGRESKKLWFRDNYQTFGTWQQVMTSGQIGTTSGTVAAGDHNHSGVYDNYVKWNLRTNGIQRLGIVAEAIVDFVNGTYIGITYGAGGQVIIANTMTNLNQLTTRNFSDLQNIPSTFAPSAHSHAWNDITGFATQADGSLRISNSNGYIDLAPKNPSHLHIYTDRPTFYFNKDLLINGTAVSKEGHTHDWADITNKPTLGSRPVVEVSTASTSYLPTRTAFNNDWTDMSGDGQSFVLNQNTAWVSGDETEGSNTGTTNLTIDGQNVIAIITPSGFANQIVAGGTFGIKFLTPTKCILVGALAEGTNTQVPVTWTVAIISAYKTRVENDYGTIEDEVALENWLKS